MIADSTALAHLEDTERVHARAVGDGCKSGKCEATGGKQPNGVFSRDEVDQTDGDTGKQHRKVGPLEECALSSKYDLSSASIEHNQPTFGSILIGTEILLPAGAWKSLT